MVLSILQVFCAIFSGLLQALSISNSTFRFGSPFIALFALLPMYFAFYSAKSYRKAFLLFFVETITVHLFSSSWLANFHGYAVFTLGASALGTGVLGGLVGIATHFFPAQLQRKSVLETNSGSKPLAIPCRILWFCASWVLWEWIKSTGLLAYPWGTISMAAYRWKILTQISDITGVWGVTFIFVLFTATLGEGLYLLKKLRESPNPVPNVLAYRNCCKFLLTVFLASGVYGCYQYFVPRTPVKYMNTIMVQSNGDPWETGDYESITTSMELTQKKMEEIAETGDKIDLILWSEGTLNKLFPRSLEHYEEFPEDESLLDFIKRMDVPFIIGGATVMDHYTRKYTNTAILFDRRGNYAGFYSKMHLVPFAELIPLSDTALMSWFMGNVVKLKSRLIEGKQSVVFGIPLDNNTVKGTDAPLGYKLPPRAKILLGTNGLSDIELGNRYIRNDLDNPDAYVTFSTPICFEDAFPDVCRRLFHDGSEIFLNITNDSWSKDAAAEYQHFIVASYRAIEFRTSLVRCTNSGYSAIVKPNGKIMKDMELFTKDSMAVSIPIYQRKVTVFSVLGDWVVHTIIFFMAVYFLVSAYLFHGEKKVKGITITIRIGKKVEEDWTQNQKDPEKESSMGEGIFIEDKEKVPGPRKETMSMARKNGQKKQPLDNTPEEKPSPEEKKRRGRPRKTVTENEKPMPSPAKRNYARKKVEQETAVHKNPSGEKRTVAKARTIKVTSSMEDKKTATKRKTGTKKESSK